jgi:peptidoglycan/LPS O-acetylase OafA/YrhL
VVSVLGWGDLWWHVLGEGTLLVHTLGAAALVVGARGHAPPSPLTAPLRAFGRLSYEIYLTHMFVVFAVVDAFAAVGWGRPEGGWAYPLAIAGSFALGWAFARAWSDPANRWLRARLISGPG